MSKFNVLEIQIKKRKSSQCLTTKRSPKESGIQQEWNRRKGERGGGGETEEGGVGEKEGKGEGREVRGDQNMKRSGHGQQSLLNAS